MKTLKNCHFNFYIKILQLHFTYVVSFQNYSLLLLPYSNILFCFNKFNHNTLNTNPSELDTHTYKNISTNTHHKFVSVSFSAHVNLFFCSCQHDFFIFSIPIFHNSIPTSQQTLRFSSLAQCSNTFVYIHCPNIRCSCFSAHDTIHRAPAAAHFFIFSFFLSLLMPFFFCHKMLPSPPILCCSTVNSGSSKYKASSSTAPWRSRHSRKRIAHTAVYKPN